MKLYDLYSRVFSAAVGFLDRQLMAFYAHTRKNARRITHLAVALLPLIMLLVGSCKTSQLPAAYGSNAGPDQFRIALFPDRVNFKGLGYYPAEGYISRAQKFVSGDPQSLLMLTGEEISYLFGKPATARHDAEAEVWQYRTESCVVDFFFYNLSPDEQGKSRVSYVDVRTKSAASASQSQCLEHVIEDGDAFFSGRA